MYFCSTQDTDEIQIKKEPLHIIAASARADAVTATITGLSRSSTSLLFREKKFSLNNRLYENSSYQLKPGDVFQYVDMANMNLSRQAAQPGRAD